MILLVLISFFLGYPVHNLLFKKSNLFEKLVLSQVFGLLITPILFVILYMIFGFNLSLIILPAIAVLIFSLSLKVKQMEDNVWLETNHLVWILIMFIIFSSLTLYIYLFKYIDNSGDVTWHMSVANSIINFKTLPPIEPCLKGTVVNYQWFWHLMLSLSVIYSNSSVFFIMPWFTIYLLILSLTSVIILCRKYFRNNLVLWASTFIFLSMYETYIIASSTEYMLPLVLLFFYILIILNETKQKRFALMLGLLSASFIYFHGFAFVFSVLALLSYALYKLVFERKNLSYLIILFAPLILSVPYYLIIKNYTSEIFLFEPFANLIETLLFEKINFLILVFLIAITKIKKKSIFLLSVIITMLVFINMFIMQRNQGMVRYYHFIFIPIIFISLDYLKNISFAKKYILLLLVLVIISYQFIYEIFLAPYNLPVGPITLSDEYKVSMWLKENTSKYDTILVSPEVENGTAYTSISERNAVLCHAISMASGPTPHTYSDGRPFPEEDYKKYFGDVILMYTSPSQDRYSFYDVKYVLLCNSERSFFVKYDLVPYNFSNAFNKVFTTGTCDAFKVDVSKLPKTSSKTINDLNFTSYSRWWGI